MIRTTILAGVAALGLAAAANAQPAPDQAMPMHGHAMINDQATLDFVTKAAQSDEFERREGRLAEFRGHDHQVKHFAKMMVKAHSKTTHDLKKAIHMAGLKVPPKPAAVGRSDANDGEP